MNLKLDFGNIGICYFYSYVFLNPNKCIQNKSLTEWYILYWVCTNVKINEIKMTLEIPLLF